MHTASTSYGSWWNHTQTSLTIAQYVSDALGIYAPDYDLEAIRREFAEAITALLPADVQLIGDEFAGPYPPRSIDLMPIIEMIDFWAIASRNETAPLTP